MSFETRAQNWRNQVSSSSNSNFYQNFINGDSRIMHLETSRAAFEAFAQNGEIFSMRLELGLLNSSSKIASPVNFAPFLNYKYSSVGQRNILTFSPVATSNTPRNPPPPPPNTSGVPERFLVLAQQRWKKQGDSGLYNNFRANDLGVQYYDINTKLNLELFAILKCFLKARVI